MEPMIDEVSFAAVGDVHGAQHLMVKRLTRWEAAFGKTLRFVLQVGDFEGNRNVSDVSSTPGPAKYRSLGDFPDFIEGRARFQWPVLTIGGNHEAFLWLDELPEGGELAPNCTYLGRAGCVEIEGLRVAYLSGIYSPKAFDTERPRVRSKRQQSWKRSSYFDRRDVENVLACEHADILVVHDWAAGAVPESEVEAHDRAHRAPARSIGNRWAREIAERLCPRLVLAGHMHYGFRSALQLESGSPCAFVALGHIARDDSIACFRALSGEITCL